MMGSDLARAVLIAAIAVLVGINGPIAAVYALMVITAVVATLFRPAQAALTPALASSPQELTAANAIAGTIESTSTFLGPGIGGLVLAVGGAAAVFGLCVAALLASALLVLSIEYQPQSGAATDTTGEDESPGVTAGVRALAASPPLLAVTTAYAAQAVVAGALSVFTVVLAIDVLDLGNAGVGYLDCAFGIGGVVGGVAAVGLSGTRRLAASFAAGVLAWGIGVALLGATASTPIALVLLTGIGAGNTVVDVAAITLLQRSAPDAILGRVFGALESLLLISLGLGSVLAPLAIHLFGIRAALIITGLLLPAVVTALGRTLLALDHRDPATARRVAVLRAHPIFAPLSEATLEQLARHLQQTMAPAGTTILREGEDGDRIFIVATGELDVSTHGTHIAQVGAGDVFGEIALLRDVPRTATVATLTSVELLTLSRDEFLTAVTGHPRSRAEADLMVGTRLAALRTGIINP
jgi:predicted MFS family arabinose efflux permease